MNAVVAQYPSLGDGDFTGSGLLAAVWNFKAFELPPRTSVFAIASFENEGIAEFVHRVVTNRSAGLSHVLRRRITELSELKPNWDGEGAKAIKAHVLADVIEALRRMSGEVNSFQEPFLAPTFDGFVQMEWHDQKRSLEIEAVDKGWSFVGTMAGSEGKHHYFTAEDERSNFQKLESFYSWFVGTEMIWPSL